MHLSEIRKKYNAEDDTIEEIKKKLRNKLKEMHPDNNDGNYDKDSFKEIKEDLEYVEKEISKEKSKDEIKLTPHDFLEIIQEINGLDIYTKSNVEDELQKKFNESVQEQSLKFKNQFKIKRYSLTGVTSLITFLWLIPDKIFEHPILKHLFNGNINIFMFLLSSVWGVLLLCTILYWLFTFKIENIEKEILERVKIESVQNELFMGFAEYRKKDRVLFSKKELMDHLLWWNTYQIKNIRLRKIVHDSISEKVIQNVADIILNKAEEQKIIRKVDNRSLIEHFEIIKE